MLIFLLFFTIPLFAQEFREHTIATGLKGGYQVVAADMNRDGKPDLIALASGMPELVWYENPTWDRHVIAGPFPRMINVAAYDTDGDGMPELALAYEFANVAKSRTRCFLFRFKRSLFLFTQLRLFAAGLAPGLEFCRDSSDKREPIAASGHNLFVKADERKIGGEE